MKMNSDQVVSHPDRSDETNSRINITSLLEGWKEAGLDDVVHLNELHDPPLTHFNYFLWRYLKDKVYQNRSAYIEDTKNRLGVETNNIPAEIIRNTIDHHMGHIIQLQDIRRKSKDQLLTHQTSEQQLLCRCFRLHRYHRKN